MEINWNAERNYIYLDEADKSRQQTQNVRRKNKQTELNSQNTEER